MRLSTFGFLCGLALALAIDFMSTVNIATAMLLGMALPGLGFLIGQAADQP